MNTTSTCEVTAIGAPDQVGFVSVDEFLAQLPARAAALSTTAGGESPIVTAIARADAVLATLPVAEPRSVLLVTDGAANCDGSLADTLARIAAWNAAGVPSLVMSLAGDSVSVETSQQLAAASGGRTAFQPSDLASLRTELDGERWCR